MTVQPHEPNLEAIKGRQQKTWSSGDYGKVGVTLVIMAENLCEAADLRSGQQVLDVATGNGNAALAAARRFCDVIGIDYVPMLLEEGREQAEAESLQVDFQEGDAEKLSFDDASFDVVLSTFGGDVRSQSGSGGERVASRLPAWRQDLPRQLDAGRLHRALLPHDRQACAAATPPELPLQVGNRQGNTRTPRGRRGGTASGAA